MACIIVIFSEIMKIDLINISACTYTELASIQSIHDKQLVWHTAITLASKYSTVVQGLQERTLLRIKILKFSGPTLGESSYWSENPLYWREKGQRVY